MTYEELKEKVKSVVSGKLGDKAPEAELLDIYLEEIEQVIINYIHYPQVPEGLKFTWANMVIDLILWEKQEVGQGDEDAVGPLASLSEGDTSMAFSTAPSIEAESRAAVVNGILHDYTGQMQEFRDLFNWGLPYEQN